MQTQRPESTPNLTISDLRIDPNFDDRIFYTLAYDRQEHKAEHEWIIPPGSNFNPPDFMEEGGRYAVWSEDISVQQTTVKGRKYNKTRQDWCWIEELSAYEKSSATQSPLTKQLMKKQKHEKFQTAIEHLETAKSLFSDLFDREED